MCVHAPDADRSLRRCRLAVACGGGAARCRLVVLLVAIVVLGGGRTDQRGRRYLPMAASADPRSVIRSPSRAPAWFIRSWKTKGWVICLHVAN